MQRIDRYGLVTLVFLIVSFLAVVVWGEGGNASFEEHFRKTEVARAQSIPPRRGTSPARTSSGPSSSSNQERRAPRAESPKQREKPREEPRQALPLTSDDVDRRTARASKDAPAGLGYRQVPVVPQQAERELQVSTSQQAKRSEPQPRSREYLVQAGDTLSEIAEEQLGTSQRWRDIVAANQGLDPKRLKVGQRLMLPGVASAPKPQATPQPEQAPGSGSPGSSPSGSSPSGSSSPGSRTPDPAGHSGTYVVRGGDTLSAIAQRELNDAQRWREIVALNEGLDPKRLVVGTRLELPGARVEAFAPSAGMRLASASDPKRSKVQ